MELMEAPCKNETTQGPRKTPRLKLLLPPNPWQSKTLQVIFQRKEALAQKHHVIGIGRLVAGMVGTR